MSFLRNDTPPRGDLTDLEIVNNVRNEPRYK